VRKARCPRFDGSRESAGASSSQKGWKLEGNPAGRTGSPGCAPPALPRPSCRSCAERTTSAVAPKRPSDVTGSARPAVFLCTGCGGTIRTGRPKVSRIPFKVPSPSCILTDRSPVAENIPPRRHAATPSAWALRVRRCWGHRMTRKSATPRALSEEWAPVRPMRDTAVRAARKSSSRRPLFNGFSVTSIPDIAEDVGMTKDVCTFHFCDNEDILLDVVNRHRAGRTSPKREGGRRERRGRPRRLRLGPRPPFPPTRGS
jgi:hypothetical protein